MLIFSYIDYENKGTYRYPTQNEWNLHNNGISSNNISMCLEIDPRAAEGKGRCPTWPVRECGYGLRNHCIRIIAVKKQNPSICDNLKNIEKNDINEIERLKKEYNTEVTGPEETFAAYQKACIEEASRWSINPTPENME